MSKWQNRHQKTSTANEKLVLKPIFGHLTQFILAKAFRGELTADWRELNPDLISGKNCAEALLARIKVEREMGKPVKKTQIHF